MRTQIVLVLIAIAVALGMSHGVCWAQPECIHVYFTLDGEEDPPCATGITTQWAIRVTSSATSASAGTCGNNEPLDNRHLTVEFFTGGCDDDTPDYTCTIYSTYPLSGKYQILEIDGACMRVCEQCGS